MLTYIGSIILRPPALVPTYHPTHYTALCQILKHLLKHILTKDCTRMNLLSLILNKFVQF